MTKEEKIKEAWGEYYDKIKIELDEHGRYNYYDQIPLKRKSKMWQFENIETHKMQDVSLLMPSSINGIDNNNGWVKIESEADLPKEGMTNYFICVDDLPSIHVHNLKQVVSLYKDGMITHYQPIEKPKPPIY